MFFTVNYSVGKLTIPTDYTDEMCIRRKVKFPKTYDANPSYLSHCVFLQTSHPLPLFVPFTDTTPEIFIVVVHIFIFFTIFSPSSPNCSPHLCSPHRNCYWCFFCHSETQSIAPQSSSQQCCLHAIRLLILPFVHRQSAQIGITLYFYLELLSVKW